MGQLSGSMGGTVTSQVERPGSSPMEGVQGAFVCGVCLFSPFSTPHRPSATTLPSTAQHVHDEADWRLQWIGDLSKVLFLPLAL